MSYKALRVSLETVPDLVRALYLAGLANDQEGNSPSRPEARELEALGRIVREWSSVALPSVHLGPEFDALSASDWTCQCGSSGLGKGGLVVHAGKALCRPCEAQAATTHAATGDRPS